MVSRLILIAVVFAAFGSELAMAKKPIVNDKLKDECAYLRQQIELTIEHMSRKDYVPTLGKVINSYGLPDLVRTYKALCD